MFFFSAEDDLKSTRGKKFCSVVWNRVHINIFVLRGCRSTITDCFFCSAEPSVMNKKYKRINCIFIHHPPHPVRFPKTAASYTLESCRVFSSTADRNRKTPRLWRKIIWCLPLQSVSCRNCFSDELKPSVNARGGNPAPSKHPAGPTSLTRREPDRVHTNILQLVQLNCDGDRNQKRLVFQSDPNIHTWLQPEIWKQNPDNLIWATVAPETPRHEKPPNTSFNTGVSCCYWLLTHRSECQRKIYYVPVWSPSCSVPTEPGRPTTSAHFDPQSSAQRKTCHANINKAEREQAADGVSAEFFGLVVLF